MKIEFVKMHGAGNDFVMIDDRQAIFPVDNRNAIASIANRPSGIGCEGIILVQNAVGTADFRMRFFNPDGSEAELCGNGARCVAVFALEIGAVKSHRMRFETIAGEITAEVMNSEMVRIAMPMPKDLRKDFVNSGVPHKIVPCEDLGSVDVKAEGRKIRNSPEFAPSGTNVDFVKYERPNKVSIRTYERGVEAESGACGTGAVAAAVVGVAQYKLVFPVKVITTRLVELTVDGEQSENGFSNITLTGPTHKVFTGVLQCPLGF